MQFALWGTLLLFSPWHELIVRCWRPLGAWDDLVLLGLGLSSLRSVRFSATGRLVAALWCVSLLSCLITQQDPRHLRAMLPFTACALAAQQVSEQQLQKLVRLVLWNAVAAALYGLVTYAVFRALGGRASLGSGTDSVLLNGLLYPYLCGAYPRGWRLVGAFLNDNYIGAYLAAVFCLCLARGSSWWKGLPLLLAWCGTLSRAGTLALASGIGYLAVRWKRQFILWLPAALLLCLPLLTARDAHRFQHPWQTEGGRLQSLRMGIEVLAEPSLLGHGPGSRGLADMQYAKIAYELGWSGALLLLAFTVWWLRCQRGPVSANQAGCSAAVVVLAVAGCGGEILEVPQTAILFWTVYGMATRR